MSEAHFKTIHFRNFTMVLISKSLKIDRRKVARLISMNNFGHKKPSQFEFQDNFNLLSIVICELRGSYTFF